MSNVFLKSVVAASTVDYVKRVHGEHVWNACMEQLDLNDRVAMSAGGNVPIETVGRFNLVFVDVACAGSRVRGQEEFRRMGAASAEKLLTGNGIFSFFAKFVSPKQVMVRAKSILETAYPGIDATVDMNAEQDGGIVTIRGVRGYAYGSQRIVGWLLRGLEIVGGRNAQVRERSWDAGNIDPDTYIIDLRWEG